MNNYRNDNDSTLSIAGNVVSFITFVLAVVAYVVAFTAATHGTRQEVLVSRDNLTVAIDQIQAMLDYCREQVHSGDPIFAKMKAEFTASLQQSVLSANELRADLASHLDALEHRRRRRRRRGGILGWNLVSRLLWVTARADINRRMARLSAKRADLLSFQLILTLRLVSQYF